MHGHGVRGTLSATLSSFITVLFHEYLTLVNSYQKTKVALSGLDMTLHVTKVSPYNRCFITQIMLLIEGQ